jgi:hypothetical protein
MIAKQIEAPGAVMPTRLQGAIVKVMRDSIENGETFIKSAREYELTEGIDNG